MNVTEVFARHALETKFTDIDSDAVNAAKIFILDTIGVGVAGSKAALADIIIKSAQGWGQASATGGAHVWGTATRLPAPSAAFVNGFQIHCQEYDCVHEGAVVHPMAAIFSALMAEVEARASAGRPVTGQELIAAVIVAVDVAAGLGVAVSSPIRFFRPANAGLFGATLGIARLRGLNTQTAMDALGYALAHCSGTMQAHVEGKPALPVQIGNAARASLLACDLAELGMTGPHNVFEGPFGYFPLYEDEWDLTPIVTLLGKIWRISEVSHKPFPTGRAAQGGIVAVQKLRDQGVSAENLQRLELTAPPIIKRLVGRPIMPDMQVNYARLCFGYSGAVTLLDGTVGLEAFSPERLADPEIYQIGKKITIIDDGTKNPAAFTPQTARAVLTNGDVKSVTINSLYGSPENRLSHEAHLQKFKACMAYGLRADTEQSQQLIDLIDTLEDVADASILARLAAGLDEND